MKRIRAVAFLVCLGTVAQADDKAGIDWQPWSNTIFETAQKEHRFVLLDLGAVWCHWCHVMENITYRDPKVIALIKERYIAVRVDQDARPDLSTRYEDYGWPATIVFNADGSEIVKRQGYIPPKPMASMLRAIIDDPSPGPSIVSETVLEQGSDAGLKPEQREKLRKIVRDSYDLKNRGWGTVQKFLDWDIIEYCLSESIRGDQDFGRMARETLDAERKLIDPVWGGVYQYSTDGDWTHPHFEKIMQMQAENLRTYAQAYALWKDRAYLDAAEKIQDYLYTFLTSPDGAFYTSQDADLIQGEHSADYYALSDAERRNLGVPRIDQHVYSRENGWAINALATFYAVTGDKTALAAAIRAADWIIANRALPDGGFRHDARDAAGPYLGDSAYMMRALVKLYAVTGDRKWLQRAQDTAQFIEGRFKGNIGYVAFQQAVSGKLKPKPQMEENAVVARTFCLIHHYSGKAVFWKSAQHAMRYLSAPALGENRGYAIAGILLADKELSTPPLHVTVIGKKDDEAARSLFAAACAVPETWKRTEWWDEREGAMPNSDVEYPSFDKAAAFVCTNRRCSVPIFDPAKIATFATKK